MKTITQQRSEALAQQIKAGFKVYNGTRGVLSHPASPEALKAMENYAKHVRDKQLPVQYGVDTLGQPELIATTLNAMRKLYPYNDTLSEEHVALLPGAQFAFIDILRSLMLTYGECNVVIQKPGYANYGACFNEARKSAVSPGSQIIDYTPNATGNVTAESLKELLHKLPKDKKTVVLLTTPNNPQSQIIKFAEMKKIIALLKERDATLILDESFFALDYRVGSVERFKSPVRAVDGDEELRDWMNANSFLVHSGSKAGAMAGLRPCAVILPQGNLELRRHMEDYSTDHSMIYDESDDSYKLKGGVSSYSSLLNGNTPIDTQIAMAYWIKSIAENPYIMDTLSKYYANNMQLATAALDNMWLGYIKPSGGLFLTIDFKSIQGMPLPQDMAEKIGKPTLETDIDVFNLFVNVSHSTRMEKVGMMPASDFGFEKDDMRMRFCFGLPPEEIIGSMRVVTNLVNRIREKNLEVFVPAPEPVEPGKAASFVEIARKNLPLAEAYKQAFRH